MALPPELPEQPQLRAAAEVLERARMVGNVLDHKWRTIFVSTEHCAVFSMHDLSPILGVSQIVQALEHLHPVGVPRGARQAWWDVLGPVVRHDVPPDDPDFEAVFGPMTDVARALEPVEPRWSTVLDREMSEEEARRYSWQQRVIDMYFRITAPDGSHVGTLHVTRPLIGDLTAARLSLGPTQMYERMLELSEPKRRQAAILFADLEASGELSRGLSSRAYFGLIRSLTDLVDESVIANGGLIGKHAGDGASALFVVDEHGESAAARGAVEAARAIRAGATALLDDPTEVLVNIGLHWGDTLTIGQIATYGRLEVTALGDQMNEAARIEQVAAKGQILASKDLLEHLSPEDASLVGLDPDRIRYTPLSSRGAEHKALRDAGSITVAEI